LRVRARACFRDKKEACSFIDDEERQLCPKLLS
jgi:hypothetical protein